ncbi:MAG: glycoside hydrolase family 97 protein [Dysgonamonadaceae bacterium]|jgi:alpha-glucosidase|nr:glycoside hydrolase family 97 protein [Dysgonamonadaceae bacterium]
MKKQVFLFVLSVLFCNSVALAQKNFTLNSPDGALSVQITVGDDVRYTVDHQGDAMIASSPVSLNLGRGKVVGKNTRLKKSYMREVNEAILAQVYKKKQIVNHYNERVFEFADGFGLIFRAYNDGIAYRFVSALKQAFVVESEEAVFNFPSDAKAYIPYVRDIKESLEAQFFNSFENTYSYISLSEWDEKRLAFAPVLIEGAQGKKVCITDADLLNYPGMFLYKGDTANGLKGVFAPYPKDIRQGGHDLLQGLVQSRESYIARCEGKIQFPWRAIIVSAKDGDLADSDMIYKLASPNPDGADFSWIKPGKVAWDWWNDWNLYHVDFKAGVNNQTYKYYIDFASENGIEYVILDAGWSVNRQTDLYQVVPEIDLKELVAYAGKRNVGLILWAGYYAFSKDVEGICKHYSEMGIKGFKVDFMDRDDQLIVEFLADASRIAAKYHLMLDFHGVYKPTGLQRTFPNVVNFEGVHGLEQLKWSATCDQVTYDVTIPFIRMVAGPMDYTQGAMRNASKDNYRPVYNEAMSQGTRCHQLAEYVIFESPLNMLCDSPSNYKEEPECTAFIASVPTVWDRTIVLNGRVGEYVTIARQKDGVWYVGSLTGWTSRTVDLDLSFLGEGNFQAEIFRDGVNADKVARDYKKETLLIPLDRKISVILASGGGCVMKITRM